MRFYVWVLFKESCFLQHNVWAAGVSVIVREYVRQVWQREPQHVLSNCFVCVCVCMYVWVGGCVFACVCVRVCACVWERERQRERQKEKESYGNSCGCKQPNQPNFCMRVRNAHSLCLSFPHSHAHTHTHTHTASDMFHRLPQKYSVQIRPFLTRRYEETWTLYRHMYMYRYIHVRLFRHTYE